MTLKAVISTKILKTDGKIGDNVIGYLGLRSFIFLNIYHGS